jgi:hypothetical protein
MGGLRAWCIFMICGLCSCFEAVEFLVPKKLESKALDGDGVVAGTRPDWVNGWGSPLLDAGGS